MEKPSFNSNSCPEQLEALRNEYEAFAYIVSHDLKAPVRAVTNLADWIAEDLDGKFTEETQAHFNLLKSRLTRLDNMIQALLEFSRATRLNLQTGTINVETCVRETIERLARDRQVHLDFTGASAELETYKEKLSGVLEELLKNAIFFNDKTELHLKVTVEDQEDHLQVSIADNGPGIPESSLDKIFEMFYTVQPKDKVETTGAGLAIVRKIINLVHGKIVAGNGQEGGAVISFTWPKELPEISTYNANQA